MTTPLESQRNPVEELADEFLARYRHGERPTISEYTDQHPDLADEIRDLFPALVMMEEAGRRDAMPVSNHKAPDRVGDYRVLREVGRGGMGIVYEAEHEALGRHVALKVLSTPARTDARHLARFQREARAAGRLHHTNIVPVFGVGQEEGAPFYVMQFIQGLGLDEVLLELRRLRDEERWFSRGDEVAGRAGPDRPITAEPSAARIAQGIITGVFQPPASEADDAGLPAVRAMVDAVQVSASDSMATGVPLPAQASNAPHSHLGSAYWRSVARIGVQVADALQYAGSQGVLHRDIKPSNLLLDADGRVWVTDFGLAKSSDSDEVTNTGDIVGTLRYLAPERLHGRSDVRGDIFSLGATLYELLTLRPMFDEADRLKLIRQLERDDPPPPRTIDPAIPRDMETIVLKAIARDARDRYQSASELGADLRRFLEDRPILARRASAGERLWRWRRRNPAVASLLAGLVVVVAAGFGGVTWQWRDAEAARKSAELEAFNAEQAQGRAEQAQTAERAARREAIERADELRIQSERMQRAFSLLEEARFRAGLKQWDDAVIAYSAAIDLRPDLAPALEERGHHYLEMLLYDQAADDIQRAFDHRRPLATWQWLRHAYLRLLVGDEEGYRQTCHEMHETFADSGNPVFLIEIVRACSAAPDCGLDPRDLVTLAETAVRHHRHQWTLHQLGVACYRAGELEKCIENCEASLSDLDWNARAINYTVLAMTYHRQGADDLANEALRLATEANENILEAICPPAGHWHIDLGAAARWPVNLLDWLEFTLLFDEARRLLGVEIPDDPRLYVIRARAQHIHRPHEALALYEQAQSAAPHDRGIELELLRQRAFTLAIRGRFADATTEYGRTRELMPDDADVWRFQAVGYLAAGDAAGHRATCREMLGRFADTSDAGAANAVVEVSVCRPDAIEDWRALLPLADMAARQYLGAMGSVGAVHFRMGEYETAIDHYRRKERLTRLHPVDSFFLAMAHHCLGQIDESQRRFDEGNVWIAEADSKSLPSLVTERRAQWGAWTDRPEAMALQAEAAALLGR